MRALFFGSIGAVTETSELQRAAFNQAFKAQGLDWNWPRNAYQAMLARSGGIARIEAFAQAQGVKVDARAVYQSKNEVFHGMLAGGEAEPRADVVDVLKLAKASGVKLGLVSITDRQTVDLVQAMLLSHGAPPFDSATSQDDGFAQKPSCDCYTATLAKLGVDAAQALAIEDNPPGVLAAKAAGLRVLAYRGENIATDTLAAADTVLDTGLLTAMHTEFGII